MAEKEGSRVWIPQSLRRKLESLKIHRREPFYEVIQRLANEYEKKEKKEKK